MSSSPPHKKPTQAHPLTDYLNLSSTLHINKTIIQTYLHSVYLTQHIYFVASDALGKLDPASHRSSSFSSAIVKGESWYLISRPYDNIS